MPLVTMFNQTNHHGEHMVVLKLHIRKSFSGKLGKLALTCGRHQTHCCGNHKQKEI